jgi:hypothetical protein
VGLRRLLRTLRRRLAQPAIGRVDLGQLAAPEPVSRGFGLERGRAVDRRYIEGFLARRAGDVRGRVLEVADPRYTRQFGGDRVTHGDVLHPVPGNPRATIIGDLATGEGLPRERYDCVIVTQTLQYVFDLAGAMRTLHALLAPGGVLLLTVPSISQLSRGDADAFGEHWRFTEHSVRRLLEGVFPAADVEVEAFGNVLAAVALLEGLSQEDLDVTKLDPHDPDYPVIVAARATRR